MHPAMIELYMWVMTGHFKGFVIFDPNDIYFLNEHGSIWIGRPDGKLSERYKNIRDTTGKYKTLAESLKEDPKTWSPLK